MSHEKGAGSPAAAQHADPRVPAAQYTQWMQRMALHATASLTAAGSSALCMSGRPSWKVVPAGGGGHANLLKSVSRSAGRYSASCCMQ